MEFFVGTSGWAYPWNEKRSLDWFVANSDLNAVELNASFYRFPSPSAVKSWAKKGASLRWSVKANRTVTHLARFSEKAWEWWTKFHELFLPLDGLVDFYLFQLPPSTTPQSAPLIEAFAEKTRLRRRFALEFRNQQWFSSEWTRWASDLGVTLVSVDSPELPRDIFNTDGSVYVRMHGRTAWYSHHYSQEELQEVAAKILKAKPEEAYVFFNNDEAMLENARTMLHNLARQ
ncbi:MAG: DUF72 domain-containing protein [Candidatus Bathyarchaeia archaeon]